MVTLAVIPSDPMSAYEAVGCHTWAKRYYNPAGFFDKVYLLSPLEKEEKVQYGMHTIPTQPRELPARLRELGVDIVRAYGGYWACNMACLNRAPGVPVVVSVHDTNPDELYRSVRRADFVLSMSEAVRDLVLTRFKHPERAWILPNRYDRDVMRPLPDAHSRELDLRYPWRYKLLCVGRLSEQKNQDTLIRALAQLGSNYGCLFVGRNEPEPFMHLAKSLGVADQCGFVEGIPNDDLPRYYNWADAMVTPSRWEGFGIVFIEALACGSVVVTSNVRPMSEYIDHERNGLLVDDYQNPRALAATIRRACGDFELRDRLARRAPRSVERFERRRVDALEIAHYTRALTWEPARRALRWVEKHSRRKRGVCHSSHIPEPYPEVTGYLIPTLLDAGNQRLARQYARWLVRIQNDDGSWNGPDAKGKPYTFDTGQILKGLLGIAGGMPGCHGPLRRGCDWLAGQIGDDGRIATPSDDALDFGDGRKVPDAFHLYTLSPLMEAARRFQRPDYADAVRRALDYYKRDPEFTDFATLSHFHAYIVEALVDLGETDLAHQAMDAIEAIQRDDGAVPAYRDVDWVCSTGLAQYALIWLKLRRPLPACRALKWLIAHQNESGGFFGSYGDNAAYFADTEIAWACKYFLDAHHLLGAPDRILP